MPEFIYPPLGSLSLPQTVCKRVCVGYLEMPHLPINSLHTQVSGTAPRPALCILQSQRFWVVCGRSLGVRLSAQKL